MENITVKELTKEEEAMINQAVLNANNTEKQHKDTLLMNVKELDSHVKYLYARIAELDQEFRGRKKLVDGINGGIAGAQAELLNVRVKATKEKEAFINELNKKMEDVEKADITLRKLIAENEALLVSNKQKQSALNEHEIACASQVFEMKKALAENQSQWNKREEDILRREKELLADRAKFEAERDSIMPELDRISSIKNENISLVKEVELQRNNNANILMGIESERQLFEEQKLVQANKEKVQADRFASEEKRLREWEQNLRDFDLETRAKSAKAEKLLRQFQLEKEASTK